VCYHHHCCHRCCRHWAMALACTRLVSGVGKGVITQSVVVAAVAIVLPLVLVLARLQAPPASNGWGVPPSPPHHSPPTTCSCPTSCPVLAVCPPWSLIVVADGPPWVLCSSLCCSLWSPSLVPGLFRCSFILVLVLVICCRRCHCHRLWCMPMSTPSAGGYEVGGGTHHIDVRGHIVAAWPLVIVCRCGHLLSLWPLLVIVAAWSYVLMAASCGLSSHLLSSWLLSLVWPPVHLATCWPHLFMLMWWWWWWW
jgi:hypothetical protein